MGQIRNLYGTTQLQNMSSGRTIFAIDDNGLLYETVGDNIVAAGSNQATATPLLNEFNRVTSGTGGVTLPISAAGLDIIVVNTTAVNLNVYPLGTDQANNQAAGVPIIMPPNAVDFFICPTVGQWFVEAGVGFAGSLPTMIAVDSLVANATGTQAASTVLPVDFNHVITAANTTAPFSALSLGFAAKPGLDIYIENTSANPVQLFPIIGGGDAINGLAVNASIVIPAFQTAICACTLAGQWITNPYFNAIGSFPGNIATQMGASLALSGAARPGGALSTVVVSAGQGNGADLTDDVLATLTLPASLFDQPGRQLSIQAMGKTGATANNKRIKVFFAATTATVGSAIVGGTLIADSGVVVANAQGWQANATVVKYGANASNTQVAQGDVAVAGSTRTVNVPVLTTAAESGSIIIAVTGSSPTTGAASDVVGMVLNVTFNN